MYTIIVSGYLALLFGAFILANQYARFALIIVSIFTYSLGLDVGLTLDPPKVTAIAGWITLFTDRKFRIATDKAHWYPFILWSVVITLVGTLFIPHWPSSSWARSSEWKPIVQLVSKFVFISYVLHIGILAKYADGKTFMYRTIVLISTISAIVSIVQVGYQYVVGEALWGVFRGDNLIDVPGVDLGGRVVQRANALGGEPKQQAMALGVGLAILFARPYLGYRKMYTFAATWLIVVAAFLTFSSGFYLVVGGFLVFFLVYAVAIRPRLRVPAIGSLAVLALFAMLFPNLSSSIYDTRVKRVEEKFDLLNDPQGLDDKDVPAFRYIQLNPGIATTGVGLGASPFYYEHMLAPIHQGNFLEPNSGVTNILFSVGIIGSLMFLAALLYEFRVVCRCREEANLFLMIYILLYFIPLTPIAWFCVVVGMNVPVKYKGLQTDC